MDKNDFRRFGRAMKALKEVFAPDMTPNALRTELYFKALEDLSIEAIEAAAMSLIKAREFSTFPKPGEIRSAVAQPPGTTALEAWGNIMTALGSGTKPQDTKILEAVRRLGGWNFLQAQNYRELRWLEKQFVEHYQDIGGSPALSTPPCDELRLLTEKIGGSL